MKRWCQVSWLAGLVLVLGGCAYTQNGPDQVQASQAAFARGDYAQAHASALRALSTVRGQEREEAAYLAGVSAYKLGYLQTAERYLTQASNSRDVSMSTDALSTLGLIYSQSGRYAQAADAFLRSADHQSGEDRAQAYFYGGIALQKLGRWPQARTSLLLARQSTRDANLRSRIDEQLAVTGYTIQLGAFSSRSNADKLAQQYALRASRSKLGSVFVTPSNGSGGVMYLVQVGRFATFSAASTGRDRLGVKDTVIVPLGR